MCMEQTVFSASSRAWPSWAAAAHALISRRGRLELAQAHDQLAELVQLELSRAVVVELAQQGRGLRRVRAQPHRQHGVRETGHAAAYVDHRRASGNSGPIHMSDM